MRKFAVISTLLCCLVFTAAAQAAEAKIGFFNIAQVGQDSDAYKAKVAELEKEFGAEGRAIQKQGEAFQKKVSDFQVQQQALTPEARADRQEALGREQRDLEAKTQTYMRKRQTAERRAEEELHRIIFYAVQEYGKREKFSFIQDQAGSAALYIDPKLDITKAILQEANKVWKEKPKALFGDGK